MDNGVTDYVELMFEGQPTRSGRKKAPRQFDRTQLRAANHGRGVHRDYAAHFFRWGWVSRHIKPRAKILDVGCGQDLPLVWILSKNMSLVPECYVGFDLNTIDDTGTPKWAEIHDQYDFTANYTTWEPNYFDYAVNFEVIEHMMPGDGAKLLEGIYFLLKPGGRLFLSTPVFNGAAALNHVHEYRIDELEALILSVGFQVIQRFGTFASKRDILPSLHEEEFRVYNSLEDYYGGDVMSVIFAPLYPNFSRNNMWVLEKPV